MKKRNVLFSALLSFLVAGSMGTSPVFAAEMNEEKPAALCPYCQQPMDDGICRNHETLVLEEPLLSTDPDNGYQQAYDIHNAGQLEWFALGYLNGTLNTEN
ncbi:MAG: hypothetical protein IKN57_14610, partial [Parasporobacterium sp.]|nr:hypothetical protein [Parasporobacterium sp.]